MNTLDHDRLGSHRRNRPDRQRRGPGSRRRVLGLKGPARTACQTASASCAARRRRTRSPLWVLFARRPLRQDRRRQPAADQELTHRDRTVPAANGPAVDMAQARNAGVTPESCERPRPRRSPPNVATRRPVELAQSASARRPGEAQRAIARCSGARPVGDRAHRPTGRRRRPISARRPRRQAMSLDQRAEPRHGVVMFYRGGWCPFETGPPRRDIALPALRHPARRDGLRVSPQRPER